MSSSCVSKGDGVLMYDRLLPNRLADGGNWTLASKRKQRNINTIRFKQGFYYSNFFDKQFRYN